MMPRTRKTIESRKIYILQSLWPMGSLLYISWLLPRYHTNGYAYRKSGEAAQALSIV
jgi:hypothetical protein